MSQQDSSSPLPRIRATAEDFRVEEVATAEPEGDGEHLHLWLEKRGWDTEAVARKLAEKAGVAAGEVGFAGRKDKHAVTRQWFSVPRVAPEEARSWQLEGCAILEVRRGRRRLRLGELAGNRFEILVREVGEGVARRAGERLGELARRGCPNLFGPQRFGHGGENPRQGAALLRGERVAGGRRHHRFLISSLQAAMFNEVLQQRPWPYDELVPGDLAFHHLSGRLELVSEAEAGTRRLAAFEVSPSGPLFGSKMQHPRRAVAEREEEILRSFDLPGSEAWRLPRGLRIFGERRPLRMEVRNASAGKDPNGLRLLFELPPGGFATTVLDQLLPGGYRDESYGMLDV